MVFTSILETIYNSANYIFSLFADLAVGDYLNFQDFLDGHYTFWLLTEAEQLPSNVQLIAINLPDILVTAISVGFGIFHFFSLAVVPITAPYVIHFAVALISWAAFTKAAKFVLRLIELLNPIG